MTKHIHADLMALYAQDAQETDRPWERWQCRAPNDKNWASFTSLSPIWKADMEYRRKPKTILINGIEVPEPMQEAPVLRTRYWWISLGTVDITPCSLWDGMVSEKMWLSRGICHSTKEAAEIHARALLSFTEVKK